MYLLPTLTFSIIVTLNASNTWYLCNHSLRSESLDVRLVCTSPRINLSTRPSSKSTNPCGTAGIG